MCIFDVHEQSVCESPLAIKISTYIRGFFPSTCNLLLSVEFSVFFCETSFTFFWHISPQDPAFIKVHTWHTYSSLITFLFFYMLNKLAMAGYAVHKAILNIHTLLINNQAQFCSSTRYFLFFLFSLTIFLTANHLLPFTPPPSHIQSRNLINRVDWARTQQFVSQQFTC